MKKQLFLLGAVFSVALAATAQTSNQTQTPPVSSTTPANQAGSGAQTKEGTPVPSTTTSPTGQNSPTGTGQQPEQTTSPSSPATGGVAGAASSSATQAPVAEPQSAGIEAVSDADLEGQIQNALNREPTLTGDSTHVSVTADSIELAGTVGTSKEKITATRIVQSYSGSKKLVNHLTVGAKASPRTDQPESADPKRTSSVTDPAAEPGKASQSPAAQPPR